MGLEVKVIARRLVNAGVGVPASMVADVRRLIELDGMDASFLPPGLDDCALPDSGPPGG